MTGACRRRLRRRLQREPEQCRSWLALWGRTRAVGGRWRRRRGGRAVGRWRARRHLRTGRDREDRRLLSGRRRGRRTARAGSIRRGLPSGAVLPGRWRWRQRRKLARRHSRQERRNVARARMQDRRLLILHVVVLELRLVSRLIRIAHDLRAEEDHQVLLARGLIASLEEESQDRNVAEE